MRQRFIDAARPSAAAAAITALARSHDVYVGCVPRTRRRGGKNALARSWTLWADCDTQESIDELGAFVPQPAIVVRSGRGLHAYWPLTAPVTPAAVEQGNRRLAHRLGACESAVTNAAAILRPPTTTNFKYDPPAAVVLERFTGERFSADYVAGTLADPPAARRRAQRPHEASSSRAGDPLLRIEPAIYIETLIGRRIGHDGKVACPFHEDKHPSLHAYPDPGGGWTCFSAKCWRGDRPNGGDIFELAGQLWGSRHGPTTCGCGGGCTRCSCQGSNRPLGGADPPPARSARPGRRVRPRRRATVPGVEHPRLPDPRLAVDGRPVRCTTKLAYAGAYQLTIWTVVGELAAELHSSYLGHPDGHTAIVHLQLRSGEPPTTVADERPGVELPVREARRLCLYDHLAALRQLAADATGQ
jgi:hypothetical protein